MRIWTRTGDYGKESLERMDERDIRFWREWMKETLEWLDTNS